MERFGARPGRCKDITLRNGAQRRDRRTRQVRRSAGRNQGSRVRKPCAIRWIAYLDRLLVVAVPCAPAAGSGGRSSRNHRWVPPPPSPRVSRDPVAMQLRAGRRRRGPRPRTRDVRGLAKQTGCARIRARHWRAGRIGRGAPARCPLGAGRTRRRSRGTGRGPRSGDGSNPGCGGRRAPGRRHAESGSSYCSGSRRMPPAGGARVPRGQVALPTAVRHGPRSVRPGEPPVPRSGLQARRN